MRIVVLLIAAGAACAQSSSPEQLFRDAVAAQQHGDDAGAVRKYQELLKSYPDAVEVRANLGAALATLGRYDEAIEQYRAVLAKKRQRRSGGWNLALAYQKGGVFRGRPRNWKRCGPRNRTIRGWRRCWPIATASWGRTSG